MWQQEYQHKSWEILYSRITLQARDAHIYASTPLLGITLILRHAGQR